MRAAPRRQPPSVMDAIKPLVAVGWLTIGAGTDDRSQMRSA